VLDVTSDLGVPTYVAILHWMQDGKENIEFGSGAHFDPRISMLRALTELNQFLSIGLMGGGSGEKSSLDGDTPLRLEDHPFLLPMENRRSHPMPARRWRSTTRATRCSLASISRGVPGWISSSSTRRGRYRNAGRQGDRTGFAAFLYPLRARAAL